MNSKPARGTATKAEIFFACFATGIVINAVVLIPLFMFISGESVSFYFYQFAFIAVFFLVFIILWPVYRKRLRHSKHFPF